LSRKNCVVYLNGDGGLVVAVGGEGLGLLGGDGGDALDERCLHPARRLNAEGEGRHVQQQQVGHRLRCVAHQNRRLNIGTNNKNFSVKDKHLIGTV